MPDQDDFHFIFSSFDKENENTYTNPQKPVARPLEQGRHKTSPNLIRFLHAKFCQVFLHGLCLA
ncbi:MAG: hypothetical protein ACPL68_04430, partial [Candidatus Hydrothermia bacterium]